MYAYRVRIIIIKCNINASFAYQFYQRDATRSEDDLFRVRVLQMKRECN